MSGFQKEYQVHYYEIDRFKEADPISILNYLEDTAIAHSESVGIGVERLLAQNSGWVLNRWHLIMERYPQLGEIVRIETWPSSFERFYARREFLITDRTGKRFVRASSLWIFFNLAKRRPLRIPQEIVEAYGTDERTAIDLPFADFPLQPCAPSQQTCLELTPEKDEVKRFHVRRSDIDTNGHVNNTRYVQWMLEGVDDQCAQDYKLTSLEVLYKKETNYGTDIESRCRSLEINLESQERQFYHQIINSSNGLEHALGRTTWQKRSDSP